MEFDLVEHRLDFTGVIDRLEVFFEAVADADRTDLAVFIQCFECSPCFLQFLLPGIIWFQPNGGIGQCTRYIST